MRRSYTANLWTDPEREAPSKYHRLSYILFRTDAEDTPILAARCPEPAKFSAGQNAINALRLDEEAQQYLFSSKDQPPMVVQTYVGVGVLDKRYQGHAGMGVYWHLSASPDSLAKLINCGVWGDPNNGGFLISEGIASVKGGAGRGDMAAYPVLIDAWNVVDGLSGEWATCDSNGCMYAAELRSFLENLAGFVECGLTLTLADESIHRIQCRRPVLLEALLLCLLTEVRTHSATGRVSCTLGTVGGTDEAGLALEMRYPVVEPAKIRTTLESVHRHLGRVGDLGGLSLQAEICPPKWGERQSGGLSSVRITLEWLRDPAVLPTSDLKADIPFDTNPQTNP